MKKLSLFFLFSLLLPAAALAAEFHSGDQYILERGKTVEDNLYVAGGNLNIEGDVNGDLTAMGGNINIAGNVSRGVTAGGGSINILGNVGQSVRVAGGETTISGTVGGDIIAAGGRIKILPGAIIEGDLVFAGGELENQGTVRGEVKHYARAKQDPNRSAFSLGWFLQILMGLVLVFLISRFFRGWATEKIAEIESGFWRNALRGIIGIILIPILIVVLFITILGIPIAAISLFAFIISLILASAIAAIWLGQFIWKKMGRGNDIFAWQPLALGVIIYQLLKLIPVIGWIGVAIMFLAAFGSIVLAPYRYFRSRR